MTATATLEKKKRSRPLDEGALLSRAVARVAENWQLTNEMLGTILGISPASASRLKAGSFRLARGKKEFELAQLLVRLFRSLDALVGSDDESAISWLRSDNLDLNARPLDLIRTVSGITAVADYVDYARARI